MDGPESSGDSINIPPRDAAAWASALYRFSRPHTMIGTAISVISVSALAIGGAGPMTSGALQAVAAALVSALLMNVSIVGLNQVYDVEIDRINKPYLPLAAGDLGMGEAQAIVAGTAAVSVAIGAATGSAPLMATLVGSLVLGILYSADLPLLRWKQHPALAASCILCVRAVLVQIGFYMHAVASTAMATSALTWTRPLTFTVSFMTFFSIVIALFKDIPDSKGDAMAGVRTLTVRLGAPRVFWTCIVLLTAAYVVGIGFGLTAPTTLSKVTTVCGHALASALLWHRARQVDLDSTTDIYDAYMFVWKLFYAEYLLIPFLR